MAETPWIVGHLDLGPSISARTVLDALPADGTGRGSTSLRRELGLDEATYAAAVDELVRTGVLRRDPGRGGTVACVVDGARAAESALSAPHDVAAPRRGPERARRNGTTSAVADSEPRIEGDGYLLQWPRGPFETIRSRVPTAQGAPLRSQRPDGTPVDPQSLPSEGDKGSGIRNDLNGFSVDQRYVVDLVTQIVRVPVEKAAIIDRLPALRI